MAGKRKQMTDAEKAAYDSKKKDLMQTALDGVAKLTTTDEWMAYLRAQAMFHNYSPNNTILILSQMETATRCASYDTWKKLGRQVKKGEKGLKVIHPMISKKKNDDGEEEVAYLRFGIGNTFDVSQTEGDELPQACGLLQGEDAGGNYDKLAAAAVTLGASKVELVPRVDSSNGWFTPSTKAIAVVEESSPLQRVKTLAHEMAHLVLHTFSDGVARDVKEMEAESVAYMVTNMMGLDTSDYSFGYLAHWSGSSPEQLKKTLGESTKRIWKAIDTIYAVLEPQEEATEDAAAAA